MNKTAAPPPARFGVQIVGAIVMLGKTTLYAISTSHKELEPIE